MALTKESLTSKLDKHAEHLPADVKEKVLDFIATMAVEQEQALLALVTEMRGKLSEMDVYLNKTVQDVSDEQRGDLHHLFMHVFPDIIGGNAILYGQACVEGVCCPDIPANISLMRVAQTLLVGDMMSALAEKLRSTLEPTTMAQVKHVGSA